MLRARRIRGNERQIDVYAHQAGQLDLRLFGRFLQTLQRHAVLTQVNAVFALEFIGDIVDQALVEVVAAQMRIAAGREHLEDTVADFHQGHVERAAAEVVNQDLVAVALIKAVSQRRRGRLVDDTLDVQTRNAAGVLGRLALRIREVRRHGDDRFGNGLAQIALRIRLQLLQDHRADHRGRVGFAVDVDLVIAAHMTLDRNDRALRVGHGLTLCNLADQALAGLREGHDGRGCAVAFSVRDYNRLAAFHNGDAGIGGTKVDANNLTHNDCLL